MMNNSGASSVVRVGSKLRIVALTDYDAVVIRITTKHIDIAPAHVVADMGIENAWMGGYTSFTHAEFRKMFVAGRIIPA